MHNTVVWEKFDIIAGEIQWKLNTRNIVLQWIKCKGNAFHLVVNQIEMAWMQCALYLPVLLLRVSTLRHCDGWLNPNTNELKAAINHRVE